MQLSVKYVANNGPISIKLHETKTMPSKLHALLLLSIWFKWICPLWLATPLNNYKQSLERFRKTRCCFG